jgi:hypothetical protein
VSRCGTQFAISIDELKELANGQVRAIVMHLLPNGRENCGYWECGSIEGEAGQSLKINLNGALRGMWTDFSAPPRTKERAGNILQLVAAVKFGHDIGSACSWVRSWLGLDNLDPNRLATEKAKARKAAAANIEEAKAKAEKNRRRALQLYISAAPYPGTLAETYLCSRAIDFRAAGLAAPGSIKFQAASYCAETQSKLPAMVAPIIHADGRQLGTHRTYLQSNGNGKATLLEAKKSIGKYQGGFIPLWKGEHRCSMGQLPPGVPIYVSEGIEDGLSVALARPSLRVIAGVSLSNLGRLELNPANPLYILGQRDEKMQAIESFASAVARLQERGHEVFLIYPPLGVKDYNELLQRDGAEQKQGEANGGT